VVDLRLEQAVVDLALPCVGDGHGVVGEMLEFRGIVVGEVGAEEVGAGWEDVVEGLEVDVAACEASVHFVGGEECHGVYGS